MHVVNDDMGKDKPDYAPRKMPNLLERDIGEETVVLSEDGRVLHSLAGTAKLIWSLIDGQAATWSLVEGIVAEYQVTEEVARADLESFLSQLESLSLLESRPSQERR
jgi:hypothetical protein